MQALHAIITSVRTGNSDGVYNVNYCLPPNKDVNLMSEYFWFPRYLPVGRFIRDPDECQMSVR